MLVQIRCDVKSPRSHKQVSPLPTYSLTRAFTHPRLHPPTHPRTHPPTYPPTHTHTHTYTYMRVPYLPMQAPYPAQFPTLLLPWSSRRQYRPRPAVRVEAIQGPPPLLTPRHLDHQMPCLWAQAGTFPCTSGCGGARGGALLSRSVGSQRLCSSSDTVFPPHLDPYSQVLNR